MIFINTRIRRLASCITGVALIGSCADQEEDAFCERAARSFIQEYGPDLSEPVYVLDKNFSEDQVGYEVSDAGDPPYIGLSLNKNDCRVRYYTDMNFAS